MRLRLASLWLALPIVGAIVGATTKPIPPHDYWWHLAMGRLIAAGRMPDSNIFLYTLPAELPFTNQPWLGQLLMWEVFDVGGPGATLLIRSIILVATFALLMWTTLRRGASPRVIGGLGMLTVLVALPVLTVRTRMFALLPFVATLAICQAVCDGLLKPKALLLLAPIAAFWANVHGSFILSPVVVGAYAVGGSAQSWLAGEFRRGDAALWGAALAAVLVGAACTPLGVGVYAYVLQLTAQSTVAGTVTEWQPVDISQFHGVLVLAAATLGTGFLCWRRRSITITDALLFGGTLVLGTGAVRGLFWWAAVIPLVLALPITQAWPEEDVEPSAGERWFVGAALAGLIALLIAVQPGVGHSVLLEATEPASIRRSGDGAYVMNNQNAFGAVERTVEDHRKRVFHDQALGGMLELFMTEADAPTQVAYVDQRMEFVPQEVWDRYFALSNAEAGWELELERIGVDTLILSPASQSPLIQAALLAPRWQLVFTDEAHLMFYASLDGAQDPAKQ